MEEERWHRMDNAVAVVLMMCPLGNGFSLSMDRDVVDDGSG
jgi:hypothetical protein